MALETGGLAYSFHLGNDRNKSKKARKTAKGNASKTTSFNNNAIQNSRQLGTVDHHNLRKYDNHHELIEIIRGTNSIIDDVKELYKKEFEEARKKYNQKQTRDDRKINDYYNKIATDDKHDLACQIIIELGDMNFWKDKSMHEKYKMNLVFDEQLTYLEQIVPQFKIANATVHYDESSPHLHIVGLAIKENCKTGMEKQVGKTTVFTRDTLRVIQDKMRKHCIETYNKIYNLDSELKPKKKGRNYDYKSNEMENVKELERQQEKHNEKLKKLNDKTDKLDNKSKEVKEILDNLKPVPLNKNNFLITNEDKQIILDYVEDVNSSSNDFKDITDYSVSLETIKDTLENHENKVNDLLNTIDDKDEEIIKLNRTIKTKNNQINNYRDEIYDLKEENFKLQNIIDFWQDKFVKLKRFLHDKIFGWFGDKEKYMEFAEELHEEDILDEEDLKELEYEKDDFDLSM